MGDEAAAAGRGERPIVLVGMMGSGKSSIGRRVGKKLERDFIDSDREIEARAGRTVPELFATDGEPAFRRLEAEVLADLVARRPAPVIATGGGAVLDPATRALLHERAYVVWLRASAAALAARIKLDGSRPLLAEDPRGTIFRLVEEREPLYAEVAHETLEVDHVERRVLAKQILRLVGAEAAA